MAAHTAERLGGRPSSHQSEINSTPDSLARLAGSWPTVHF